MKNIFLLGIAGLILFFSFQGPKVLSVKNSSKKVKPSYKEGDLIFQTSIAGQGKAIQLATHSPYTHVGMLIKQNEKWMVLEAIQPVCITPLQEFIDRGDKKFYVIKRLKDESFAGGSCLSDFQKKHLGKPYDPYFGWGDDKLYCSELVYKVYKNCCQKEIGSLTKMKDLDLSHPVVQFKLKERYGDSIPYEEKVITPASMYDSPLLKEIDRN